MSNLKDLVIKDQEYDAMMKSTKILKIHTKGFMFDSLIYRFKDYQARAFQSEIIDYKYKYNCSEVEARNVVADRHNRDLMRFIEILNEAIGEHD